MCFSPEADFAVAAVLAPVGVAALRAATRREELLIAALPLLFACHQALEGVVWLGLEGDVAPAVRDAATGAYLAFAQVVLPLLVPLALLAIEPGRRRRWAMAGLLGVGAVVAWRFAWILTHHPIGAQGLDRLITYDTDAHFGYVLAAGYVAATCGPALLSSRPGLRPFGLASLLALGVAALVRYSAVTSVWCLSVALISVLVLLSLRAPAPTPQARSRPPRGSVRSVR